MQKRSELFLKFNLITMIMETSSAFVLYPFCLKNLLVCFNLNDINRQNLAMDADQTKAKPKGVSAQVPPVSTI